MGKVCEADRNIVQDVTAWLDRRRLAANVRIERKPIAQLRGWTIDPASGNLGHQSGKFFQIAGIEVKTNFGGVGHWTQPIIFQREVGLIGFLSKRIGGVLHLLVQAKMEPGNINLVQLSPTVQATRSNFTQVHGGERPRYLDYFLNCRLEDTTVDQLQSEQGSKFFRKRNRNMIVQVPDDAEVPIHEDFIWLALDQIRSCLGVPNLVNMDARSVLSGVDLSGSQHRGYPGPTAFHDEVSRSALPDARDGLMDFSSVDRWFAGMKAHYHLNVNPIDLKDVEDWIVDGESVHHVSGRFFSVIGVGVSASSREVLQWDQPLIESAKGGIACFLCRKFGGVLHFLVQARVEAGAVDGVELGPTLQYTPANYTGPSISHPPFADAVRRLRPGQFRYDSLQSEEGGRFYHDQNRYVIAEADVDDIQEIPENYCWLTMRQIKDILRFNNCFNVEARSLVACVESIR
jgi:oxidase EvaA